MKSYVLAFSHIKVPEANVTLPWKCQGQPKVIIWTFMVVLMYPMLHTKFQGRQSISSGEVLIIYGRGGYIGEVTWTFWTTVRSPGDFIWH